MRPTLNIGGKKERLAGEVPGSVHGKLNAKKEIGVQGCTMTKVSFKTSLQPGNKRGRRISLREKKDLGPSGTSVISIRDRLFIRELQKRIHYWGEGGGGIYGESGSETDWDKYAVRGVLVKT